MAPKTTGKPVLIRIPEHDLERIDARCAKTGLSRAETIRKMLAWALTQPEPKGKK